MARAACPTLKDLAGRVVRFAYRHHWRHTKPLLPALRHDLLTAWLRCDEEMPDRSDEEKDPVRRAVQGKDLVSVRDSWRGMHPFSPQIFVNLMMLPTDDVPPFAYERTHLIWRYYIWTRKKRAAVPMQLCEACFSSISRFYRRDSANRWDELGWSFVRCEAHTVVPGIQLLKGVVWKANNWCRRCVVEPLVIDMVDLEECDYEYDCPRAKRLRRVRRRTYDDSSSDEDDHTRCDMMDDTDERTVVKGNRLPDLMYRFLKDSDSY